MAEVKQDATLDVKGAIQRVTNNAAPETPQPEAPKHGDVVVGSDGVAGIVIDRRVEAEKNISPVMREINSYIGTKDQSIANMMQNGENPLDVNITQEDLAKDQEVLQTMREKAKNDPNMIQHLEALEKVNQEVNSWDVNAAIRASMVKQQQNIGEVPQPQPVPQPQNPQMNPQQQIPPQTEYRPPNPQNLNVDDIYGDALRNEVAAMAEQAKAEAAQAVKQYQESQQNPQVNPQPQVSHPNDIQPQNLQAQMTPAQEQPQNVQNIDSYRQNVLNEYQGTTVASGTVDTEQVQFNVPEGESLNFISTLPISERDKVHRTTTIVVNEVKKKTVPTATRRIENIQEFNRIVPRKVQSETIGVALINSGIYCVFKGAGSLAMATLIPDRVDANGNPIRNYAKRYQFAYNQLVDSSIGRMSFNEFCVYVAVKDLDSCIYAILRVSEPEDNSITLICGNEDCQAEYDIKYKVSKLVNADRITPEMGQELKKITDHKDILEEAKRVHAEAPVMQIKNVDVRDNADGSTISFDIKIPSGPTVVQRYHRYQEFAATFSNAIARILMYIPKAYYTTSDGTVYETIDADSIVALLTQVNDETLTTISKLIGELREFPQITYSFKGEFYCPRCRRYENRIPCELDSLVFWKIDRLAQE